MKLDHVLVIRPGALGDAVLTLPALHALLLAGAQKISILGTPRNWSFLTCDPARVKTLDFGAQEWLGLSYPDVPLPARIATVLNSVDLAVVYLAAAPHVPAVLARYGVKHVIHVDPPRLDQEGSTHASRQLLEPLRSILTDDQYARSQLPAETKRTFLRLPARDGIDTVHFFKGDDTRPHFVIHPGSGGLRKCWPAERYIKLASRLTKAGKRVFVLFGYADEAVQDSFQYALPSDADVTWVVNGELHDVLALLTDARGYAGNDSGVSHLAARVCPATVLFGPTNPEIWSPLGPDVRILRAPEGRLVNISVEQVLESLLR